MVNKYHLGIYSELLIFGIFLVPLILFISPINSWGFGEDEHTQITANALSFLRDEILIKVIAGDLSQDDFPASWHAENHFDA